MLFNLFSGFIIFASSLIGASFVGCHQTALAVFFISFALIGSGCLQSGYGINHLDVGARYAGVLMAITNTAATIPGIVAPYIVGILTNNQVYHNKNLLRPPSITVISICPTKIRLRTNKSSFPKSFPKFKKTFVAVFAEWEFD